MHTAVNSYNYYFEQMYDTYDRSHFGIEIVFYI